MSKPLVSVWMAAYYVGDYIGQAIESILCQKTDYPYEIVINDDCSGDNTWQVISDYAEKYPDIIRAKRNEQNLGLSANVLDTKTRCRGKYIVNLSGDDYWIDENKIQKQADFLESHPDYVGVGSKVEIRYGDATEAASSYPNESVLGGDYTLAHYNANVNLPSHGFMIRNIFSDPDKRARIEAVYGVSSTVDDLFDPVLFLEFGKIYIMKEATCVYRTVVDTKGKHNFNSTRTPLKKTVTILEGYNALASLQLPGVDLRRRYVVIFNHIVLACLASRKFGEIGRLYRTVPREYRNIKWACFCGVWSTAFRTIGRKIKRRRAKKQGKVSE